jgi:hypothetical protein
LPPETVKSAKEPDVRVEEARERPAVVPVPVVVPKVIFTDPVEAGANVMFPDVVVDKAKSALVLEMLFPAAEVIVKAPEVVFQRDAPLPVILTAPVPPPFNVKAPVPVAEMVKALLVSVKVISVPIVPLKTKPLVNVPAVLVTFKPLVVVPAPVCSNTNPLVTVPEALLPEIYKALDAETWLLVTVKAVAVPKPDAKVIATSLPEVVVMVLPDP